MENVLPPAQELVLIDQELVRLDARRTQLLTRRAWLVGVLYPRQEALAPSAGAPAWGAGVAAARKEGPGVQNVLLSLGAVLLAVAALAFTVVSWGALGIGGRSAVLAVVTLAASAVPVVLVRRGMGATAEAVAGVGLALTVLDAYALHRVALPDVDGLGYAAGASAVLAAVWAGYGALCRGLRLPLPAAVTMAQPVLPLAALAAGAGVRGLGWAFLGSAVLSAGFALSGRGGTVPRALAGAYGAMAGAGALLVGLAEARAAGSAGAALAPGALLVVGAGAAGAVSWRLTGAARRPGAVAAAATAGVALVGAGAGVLGPVLAAGWSPFAYLVPALPLVAAVRAGAVLPERVRSGLALTGAGVAGLCALAAAPVAAAVLADPGRVLERGVWAGLPAAPAAASWPGYGAAPAVLAVTAALAWLLHRSGERRGAAEAALSLGWAALFLAPVTAGAGHAAVLVAQVAVTAGAAAAAGALPGARQRWTAAGCAAVGGSSVAVLALAGRPGTFAVLAALAVAGAAVAGSGRAERGLRGAAGAWAVAAVTGLSVATGAAAGLSPTAGALLVLVVPAAAVAVAPRLPVRVPVEVAGAVAGLLAPALAARGDAAGLALVLAAAGVVAAGAAVRADRRKLGYAAAVLFVLATWVRLAASEVAVPEAYALPVTVPALAVGLLRRRRDPEASSWTAYGPGLAATLLPSLVAAWQDAHWLRPLLLGLGALGVTLAGARFRLRAPLLLGGAVLVLVALHELAPYVVQVAGVLPRWLPPALAGVLLLAVGSTYEKRLRDARPVPCPARPSAAGPAAPGCRLGPG
ncbi:hypothetical protein, partial [Streptomyces sp. NPDC097619]|uniref:SCO7613 C-terminal domain-containing membrane protein n=1 Tax=Streptomyces sp. NPDC097619 TaxID=3157228 RepID=UPI00333081A3